MSAPELEPMAPLLVDAREAARLLSVSERTIQRMIQAQELPVVRVRGRVLLPVVALEAYVFVQTQGGGIDKAKREEEVHEARGRQAMYIANVSMG